MAKPKTKSKKARSGKKAKSNKDRGSQRAAMGGIAVLRTLSKLFGG